MRKVCSVYVDKAVYSIDEPYEYIVPPEMEVVKGSRVLVPFSNSNRKTMGIVSKIGFDDNFEKKLKPIYKVLDEKPLLNQEMLDLIEFMVRNTFCTHFDAVRAILPVGTLYDISDTYSIDKQKAEEFTLTAEENNLLQFLSLSKTAKEMAQFLDCRGNVDKAPIVKSLMQKGIVKKDSKVSPKVSPKKVKMIRYQKENDILFDTLSKKQKEVAKTLKEVEVATVKELCTICGVTVGVVNALYKKGIADFFYEEISYNSSLCINCPKNDVVLSDEQTEAFIGIKQLVDNNSANVALLNGVTGSGKTKVYIKLIEYVLSLEKTAIMLVPEISLTPQTAKNFIDVFGDIVCVIHSGLSVSERLNQFNKIKCGECKIVIGTRSAIFSPLENIGIIILDEEGESSYKSETTPRYHAREIAKFRAVKHNATLVLGSATPCIESYYYAKTGRYSLFTLDKRYKNAKLPSVFIVDMTKEPLSMSPLSQALEAQIEVNLKNNEQTILLINRRGYHTYASCMQCGDVIKCPNCDVSLTYHKSKETLMCHYCGFQESFDVKCPSCGGKYISFSGIGTQKLEDYLIKRFEGVRILRMDGDTTTKKDSYIKAFTEFDKGKYDIMVGTQMVAKGLDFPNVTLVGIINADSGLYSADYKSTERIFSLITQVVGRSGRSQKSGRAYIQSLNPENSVILKAASQNYNDFFDEEIAIRKIMTYPPFCDICVIGFSGINEKNTIKSAEAVLSMLSKLSCQTKGITMKVLGITPANIYKINNKYRYRIIIKCKYTNTFKQFISKVLKSVSINNVSVFVDINGDIN